MQSVLRRAVSTAMVGALAGGGLLIAAAPPAGAATSCATACIVNASVEGTPEGAVFDFATTGLTRAKIVVTDTNGGNPYVVKNDDTWGSTYDVTAEDTNYFQQGKPYRYTIYATDTAGDTWSYSGVLVTLKRTAVVHYSKLHLINDGDPWGPGEIMGTGRCGESQAWDALSPLSPWVYDAVEMNDGDNRTLDASFSCASPVGKTIEAESAVADDDSNDVDLVFWSPTSPHALYSWNEETFNEAYTAKVVTDPLAPTAMGSADVPLDLISPATDPVGHTAKLRYEVIGNVTFTQTVPPLFLPAPVSARASLDAYLSTDSGDPYEVIDVHWNPNALPALGPATGYVIQWRQVGYTTWQENTDLVPNDSGLNIYGLKHGAAYDVAVSRVVAGGLRELYSGPIRYTMPGVPLKPSTLSGWSTTTVTAPLGTVVTSNVQVSASSSRLIQLQSRKAGGTWTTAKSVWTDATGHATLTYKVGVGYYKWRVYVPWTDGFDEITSGERTLAPQTVISGFNTTTVTAPTGTKINDAVVVTPAVNRAVNLYYKQSGASTWTLAANLTTDANGAVTLPEVAKKGTYVWDIVVPFNVYQGTATWSANRTIIGT